MLSQYLDQGRGDVATVGILQASLHAGTHVDAPMHFVPGRAGVDSLDPLALAGSAVVQDIASGQDWRRIGAEDVLTWEAETGESIGTDDVGQLRTGHASHRRDLPEGTKYMTAPWPYVSLAAADLFVERRVRAPGVECPDPDKVDQRELAAATFETHKRLLGANIPIIKNLANLDRLTAIRVDFLALALPIRGPSGSPVRALAFLPE